MALSGRDYRSTTLLLLFEVSLIWLYLISNGVCGAQSHDPTGLLRVIRRRFRRF
jgi:hypothetical protein